jgi:hypothetical protein
LTRVALVSSGEIPSMAVVFSVARGRAETGTR